MIAQALGKLLAATAHTGKDKVDGREFTWYKNDIMTQQGVISLTSGPDYSLLLDKAVLVSIEVEGKDKCKLVKLELAPDESESDVE